MRLGVVIYKLVLIAALVYAAFVFVLFLQQRSLLYHPHKKREAPPAIAAVAAVRTADGLALEGWYFKPQTGKPVLVYYHGNAGAIGGRLAKIPDYVNAGYGVLLAEYRGFGGNPGTPTESGLYQDGWAYLDWLAKEQGIGPEQIVLYGESLGTGVSVELAAQLSDRGTPPLAVVLEAPFTSVLDLARGLYFFIPVDLLLLDRYMSAEKIKRVRAPVFMINGQDDEVIPQAHGKALFQIANEPKKFVQIPGGHHNDLHLLGLSGHVLEFLAGIDSRNRDNGETGISGE